MISKRLATTLLRLSIAVTIIGALFKILHWNFSKPIMIIGLGSIAASYTVLFYLKKSKRALDYSKLTLIVTFILQYGFRVFHWKYATVFNIFFQVALVLFIVFYIRELFLDKNSNDDSNNFNLTTNSKKENLQYLLYSISGIAIITGAIFKIIHFNYGNELLIIGLILAAITVLMKH